MSVEENKAIMRRFWEEVNKKNLAVVDELFATNYVAHTSGGQELHGLEEYKQYLTTQFTASPDIYFTVEDMVAEGDKVAARVRSTGTHQGELMGIAPTGKKVTATGIVINRIVGGKFAETWAESDMLGLMQQIGAIPTPGQG